MEPGFRRDRLRQVGRAAWKWTPLVCFVAVISAYYMFVVSAGRWDVWPLWTAFDDAQAEGFRQGHLYLPEVPSAALRHLADPLNPANMPLWRWDHSYYHGRFYLYWGLVPALLLAAVKVVFQIHRVVPDSVVVFAFFVGRLVAGTLLIRGLAGTMSVRPPRWAVGLAMTVFALAHPTPYTLARGAVYEVAIGAGACFMVAALGLAFRGIFSASPRTANRWLAAASVCFGLAGGSRVSLFPAVVLLVALTALARWRIDGGDRRRLLGVILASCAPAAALALGHLVLNRLRYDAWTEFGARYQLGYPPLRAGLRFVIPDLFAYLFCPPTHACGFPFLFGKWNTTRPLSPSWLTWPADHHTAEPTTGLLTVAAFCWLAVGGLLFAITRRRVGGRAVAEPPPPAAVWRARWVGGALVTYVVASAVPLVLLSSISMRYEADFASGVLLIAILVGWRLVSSPASRRARAAAAALYVLLAIGTIVPGVLLGFSGYFDNFARHNPALLHRLESRLSVCPVERR
jgi:hypothetical protein